MPRREKGYILHTIHGTIDAEILTSKTAQTIIKILYYLQQVQL